jgi:hypothetical protein
MDFIPEIKSGIPIPAGNGGKHKAKYNWLFKMKVGDCVDLPDYRTANLICSSVYQTGIGPTRKKGAGLVKQRAMNENGKTFYRLWRVA